MMSLAAQSGLVSGHLAARLRWGDLYREAELYKAAVRLYTKPLFSWRKALSSSTDSKNLYDFARHGLQRLETIHRTLVREEFEFRPGLALRYNFNGKKRTLYIYPWEERLVDLLLYRLLSRRLHAWFSPHSYAYRQRGFGVDRCQRRIAEWLRSSAQPVFVLKRDIADYFPSLDHDTLLSQLSRLVDADDYLFALLQQRIRFHYQEDGNLRAASRGIPFGTAIACLFANVYLTDLDERLCRIPGIRFFRYADDLLVLSTQRESARAAAREIDEGLHELKLRSKPSHELDILFASREQSDHRFRWAAKFRHLGLEFRADGPTGLSRDKFRKICNLFRYAFRRNRAKFARMKDPLKKARHAVEIAQKTIATGVRNVAIIDYYLKHVEDEDQLRLLDRWLAEEVLSLSFGGHRKGHFRKMSYAHLRAMGLPSLVHRRRLIRHGQIDSPFFIWKSHQQAKSSRGMAARPRPGPDRPARAAFSPCPEAAVNTPS